MTSVRLWTKAVLSEIFMNSILNKYVAKGTVKSPFLRWRSKIWFGSQLIKPVVVGQSLAPAVFYLERHIGWSLQVIELN